jgi:hypothetical protein
MDIQLSVRGCRDRMVVGFIATYAIYQSLSPLTLWVRFPLMARCTRYNIMWYILIGNFSSSPMFYDSKVWFGIKHMRQAHQPLHLPRWSIRWMRQSLINKLHHVIFHKSFVFTKFQLYRGGGNGVHGENQWPAASHWQTLSHNIVSSTPRHEWESNSQRKWW